MENGKSSAAVEERRPKRLLGWPEEFERLFGRRTWPWFYQRSPAPSWTPEVDMFEKDGKLVVRTDIPGMRPEDISVTLEGDVLTIKGHREEEKEVKEEAFYCSERASGDFFRSVRVPEGTKAEEFAAHYEHGVLEVTVPLPSGKDKTATTIPVK